MYSPEWHINKLIMVDNLATILHLRIEIEF